MILPPPFILGVKDISNLVGNDVFSCSPVTSTSFTRFSLKLQVLFSPKSPGPNILEHCGRGKDDEAFSRKNRGPLLQMHSSQRKA